MIMSNVARSMRPQRVGTSHRPIATEAWRHNVADTANPPSEGLMLLNMTLDRAALDSGARKLLSRPNEPDNQMDVACYIPEPVKDFIRQNIGESEPARMAFPIGGQQYMWRAYRLDSQHSLTTEPLIVLHVEKVEADLDPIHEVASRYNLSERECETLRGVSMGLGSKELADLMGIKPNTVKAFVRVVMLKMGVSTRAEAVATLFKCGPLDRPNGLPGMKKPISREDTSLD
jgi:DNA-binding CsgD family transcriptional regulator